MEELAFRVPLEVHGARTRVPSQTKWTTLFALLTPTLVGSSVAAPQLSESAVCSSTRLAFRTKSLTGNQFGFPGSGSWRNS